MQSRVAKNFLAARIYFLLTAVQQKRPFFSEQPDCIVGQCTATKVAAGSIKESGKDCRLNHH
jgi:hypothetical protein